MQLFWSYNPGVRDDALSRCSDAAAEEVLLRLPAEPLRQAELQSWCGPDFRNQGVYQYIPTYEISFSFFLF